MTKSSGSISSPSFSLNFEMTYIGRGLNALYCWRSDCLCPAGFVILSECGDGSQESISKDGLPSRKRADIIHIYVVEWSRGLGIGHAMIQKLQAEYDVIHTPVAINNDTESLLKDSGFVHNAANIDWSWARSQKPRLVAGHEVDKALAILLGWKNVEVREAAQEKGDPIKVLVGIPPMGEEIKPVPSWSTDKALALGLLVELGERSKFDYQWWKFGGNYSCGIRSAGSVMEAEAFADEETSAWYPSFPLAISHALIVYLQRLRQQKKAEREAAAAVAAADSSASSAPKS